MSLSIFFNCPSIYKYSIANNSYIIIVVGAGSNTIAKTSDVLMWSGNNTVFSNYGSGITKDNTKYYAVGQGTNTLASSIDGVIWTAETSPFSTAGYDILYSGSTLVACGTGTNAVAYYNGTSWIPISNGLTTGLRIFL